MQCFDCPASCLACELSNPKQETSALKCTSCITGFEVRGTQCVAICKSGEYFNATAKDCFACNFACKECHDDTDYCDICQDSFSFVQNRCTLQSSTTGSDQNTSSVDQNPILSKPDCGFDAYYDDIAQSCVCENVVKYFNETSRLCQEASENICSVGFYKDTALDACVQCSAKEGVGRCS